MNPDQVSKNERSPMNVYINKQDELFSFDVFTDIYLASFVFAITSLFKKDLCIRVCSHCLLGLVAALQSDDRLEREKFLL